MRTIFDLPLIIPKKRLFSAIIGILIASTIFVTTNTVLISMTEVSEDIFGTDENVTVFYNTATTTPFTSRVSVLYGEAFSMIQGVDVVSPEIFQAVTINDKSAYLRGAIFDRIKQLDSIKIIDGEVKINSIPNTAVIGSSLAKRLQIKVGDIVSLASIITEERIDVSITGIYQSDTVSDDEIMVSPQLARTLAVFDDTVVSHYRIKYDPDIVTQERLLELGQKQFSFDLNLSIGNNTNKEELSLDIVHTSGTSIVNDKQLNTSNSFNFIRGTYRILIHYQDQTIYNRTIIIPDREEINFELGYDVYLTTLNLHYNEIPITNTQVNIFQNSSVITSGRTIDGQYSFLVEQGQYRVEVVDDLNNFVFDLEVVGSQTLNKSFQYNPVNFTYFQNNTVYLQNNPQIPLNAVDLDFEYYLNGSKVEMEKYLLSPNLPLNLENGNYKLDILYNGLEYQSFTFSVNNSKNYFASNVKNNDYIAKGEAIYFDITGIREDTIESNLDYTIIGNTLEIDTNGIVPGYGIVRLSGSDYNGKEYLLFIRLFFKDSETSSWIGGTGIPVVKTNDTLDLWVKGFVEFNDSFVNYLQLLDDRYQLEILNQNETGSPTNPFVQIDDPLYYLYVSNYSSLFNINSISFQAGVVINSSTIQISFPNFSFPNHTNHFWDLQIKYQGTFYKIYDNQEFFVNESVSLQDVELYITNLITKTTEIVNFAVNSSTTIPIENKISGLPKFNSNGQVNLENWSGYSFNIYRNNQLYSPIFISNSIFRALSGNYSIEILDFSGFKWNFTILEWQAGSILQYISNQFGYINDTASASIGGIYYTSSVIRIGQNSDIRYNVTRDPDTDTLAVEFFNLFYGEVNVLLNDNPILNQQLTSNILVLDSSQAGQYNITLNYTTMRNVTFTTSFVIDSFRPSYNYEYTIDALELPNQSVSVHIFLHETDELLQFSSVTKTTKLSFTTIPQNYTIRIYNSGTEIYKNTSNLGSKLDLNFSFGSSIINFNFTTPNFEDAKYIVEDITISNSQLEFSISDIFSQISLPFDTYNFQITTKYNVTAFQYIPNGDATLDYEFPLYNSTVLLTLTNLNPPMSALVHLEHQTLDFVIEKVVNFRNPTISLTIPVGYYKINLSGEWGKIEDIFEVLQLHKQSSIRISSRDNSNPDLNLNQALRVDQVGFSVSSDYLDNFLSGALLIIQSIIITEVIVMLIIIFVNFNEIIRFMVVESKHELQVLDRIGASKIQVMFSFIKPLFLLGLAIPIASLLLGQLIIEILFNFDFTVFFGHQFSPSVFHPTIVSLTFLISYGLIIYSTSASLNLEIYSDRDKYGVEDSE